jgi:hypothetical protein
VSMCSSRAGRGFWPCACHFRQGLVAASRFLASKTWGCTCLAWCGIVVLHHGFGAFMPGRGLLQCRPAEWWVQAGTKVPGSQWVPCGHFEGYCRRPLAARVCSASTYLCVTLRCLVHASGCGSITSQQSCCHLVLYVLLQASSLPHLRHSGQGDGNSCCMRNAADGVCCLLCMLRVADRLASTHC